MQELFQKSKATISEHIKNTFQEGELYLMAKICYQSLQLGCCYFNRLQSEISSRNAIPHLAYTVFKGVYH